MKSFDFSFLKNIERRVVVITVALFVAIFTGGVFGDMVRGFELNFTYALINAFFISLSVGAVMIITKTREKDKEKKSYRAIRDKQKRKK